MDAELKEYLDDFKAQIAQHFEVVETRLGARIDVLRNEMRDGFISVDERLRTVEARLDRLEARMAQQEARQAETEARLANIERELAHINTRLDTLSDDMRQRFRVLTDRVAAIETRLAA